MYIHEECEATCKEYKKMVKERSAKNQKIWTLILVGFVVVLVSVALFTKILENETGLILYFVYGGMILVGLIVAVFISFLTISEKPAFRYLYKEIYDKINLEKGVFYEYTSYEKGDWDFNKIGGIFSKFCRVSLRRHLKGTSPNYNSFDIFDTILITGSGKNKHVHLNGMYFVVKKSNPTLFQVRTNGKPHLKGIKYDRVEDIEEYKVYLEEGKTMSNIEHKFMETVTRLKRNLKAKKVYLSVTHNEIHFAYVPKVPIRKQYNISILQMNEVYNDFLDEIRFIDELVDTTEF